MRWYGIDFSGDHTKWLPGIAASNVWIAAIEERAEGRRLCSLERVQQLSRGYGEQPFERLAALLREREFCGAGIDAPFSVPREFVQRFQSYSGLLEAVRGMRLQGRPFPEGRAFVEKVTGSRPPLEPPKPLRRTEEVQPAGVNIRSTLWAGARSGAPMTAACLRLLAEAQCPIWPWAESAQAGLLIEAFPAAQLRSWGLPYQGYNGQPAAARAAREAIVGGLAGRVHIPPDLQVQMLGSADALDAVVCAFAAIAVTEGRVRGAPEAIAEEEGWIAVHA